MSSFRYWKKLSYEPVIDIRAYALSKSDNHEFNR